MPKEDALPIPLKYIDVTRSTHTNLDGENSSRIRVVWGAPDEDSSNYRTRLLVAGNLVRNVQSCQQEKQEWASQRPKLNNARKLRGIHCIDPEDGEYKETIKNARKKLEVQMEAAMPCKMGTRKRLGELQETAARGIT